MRNNDSLALTGNVSCTISKLASGALIPDTAQTNCWQHAESPLRGKEIYVIACYHIHTEDWDLQWFAPVGGSVATGLSSRPLPAKLFYRQISNCSSWNKTPALHDMKVHHRFNALTKSKNDSEERVMYYLFPVQKASRCAAWIIRRRRHFRSRCALFAIISLDFASFCFRWELT